MVSAVRSILLDNITLPLTCCYYNWTGPNHNYTTIDMNITNTCMMLDWKFYSHKPLSRKQWKIRCWCRVRQDKEESLKCIVACDWWNPENFHFLFEHLSCSKLVIYEKSSKLYLIWIFGYSTFKGKLLLFALHMISA